MPIIAKAETAESIGLAELVARLDKDLHAHDHSSMLSMAEGLKALSNNRTFLARLVEDRLKAVAARQVEGAYTAQSIMIHYDAAKNYFLRANVWPAAGDNVFHSSGPAPFLYHFPHDHNFNFLTVGYCGPGYWSDYYTYDRSRVAGYVGEPARLRFVERSALTRGKVMLYRAGIDVHDQLPPDEFSISLNIMENTLDSLATEQYAFNTTNNTIAGVVSKNSLVSILSIAAAIGDGNTLDIVEQISQSHGNPRIRFNALESLARRTTTREGKIDILSRGLRDKAMFVRKSAEISINRLGKTVRRS